MRHAAIALFAFAFALPLACGKDTPPTTEPATGNADAAAAPEGAASSEATPWSQMDHEAKKQHMMHEVTPQMATLFRGFSAEHYAEFNCVTCHGPGAKQGEFDMPSPSLPKLPANADFSALMEREPEMMQFMGTEVVPEMAALLDMPPYDPATHEGFGCFGCHQAEG